MNERGSAFDGASGGDFGWGLLIVLGALIVAHACNRYLELVTPADEADAGQIETYQEATDGE